MSFLEDKIKKASQKYYAGEDSGMSDAEFDKYMAKYEEENPDSELLTAVGHGYDVDKDSTPGKKVKHKYGVAGSLTKAYTWKEFNPSIASGMELHASLKLDGLSIVLYYNNGKLIQALTRGNGVIGIDVTEVISYILCDKDKNLKDTFFTGAVRGEILMTHENFRKFKELHPEAKNPRNSAAGLINSNKVCPELSYLHVRVYTVVGIERSRVLSEDNTNRRTIQAWLADNFSNVVPFTYVWIDEESYMEELNDLNKTWEALGIPSDGIVLSDISVSFVVSQNLGYEIVYNSQAFKFQSETAESNVVKVEWELTKNRRLMPTIVVEPVELAGTTVQRATGYNAKYILDNKIDTNAVVEIEKHGEIIPNVNKVIRKSIAFMMPKNCPRCNTLLEWSGVDLICPNTECGNAVEQDTLMWLKHLVPTDGMGDTLILKFLKGFYGDNISVEDIMSGDIQHFISGERAGSQIRTFKKMMSRLLSDTFNLKDALEALNIPRLGVITSEKLAQNPDVAMNLLTCNPEEAYDIARIVLGNADARSISDNLDKYRRLSLIKDRILLDSTSDNISREAVKVAITGKLSVARSKFEEELKAHGFKLGDVTKDTKYLITDDPSSNSSKNTKADKLGVEKITEEEFRKRCF